MKQGKWSLGNGNLVTDGLGPGVGVGTDFKGGQENLEGGNPTTSCCGPYMNGHNLQKSMNSL